MTHRPTVIGRVAAVAARAVARSALPAAVGLAVVSAAAAAAWEVRPDRILVEKVAFVGASRSRPAELRHLARVPNGTTVWEVDEERVARRVARHPWVRSAEANLVWPGHLVVSVEEHVPVALLHQDGGLVWVDEEGEPFLAVDEVSADSIRPGDLDHVHLTGFAELGQWHPELPGIAIRDALWLIRELDDRGLLPRDRVSQVSFSRASGFLLVCESLSGTPGARLRFGPAGLPAQVDRLAVLLDRGVSLDQPVEVDLAPATVALVRPLTPPPPPAPTPGSG